MKSYEELSRPEQVLLYVVAMMDELKAKGFVEGGWAQSTEQGRKDFAQMNADGWEPEEEEIEAAMDWLNSRAEP